LSAGNLRASLMDVGQRFPEIEIEMFESSRTRLATALRNGVVDIVIVPGAASLPKTNTVSLWSERIKLQFPRAPRSVPRKRSTRSILRTRASSYAGAIPDRSFGICWLRVGFAGRSPQDRSP
jgi:DNA-binding transcriptional LysR family regulator